MPLPARWARRALTWLPPLALAGCVTGLHLPVLGHRFLLGWDDLAYVADNPAAHGPSWSHLRAALGRVLVGTHPPLHVASCMLDHRLWGLWAAGYALDNALLHAANAALLHLLLLRLVGRPMVALVAASAFAFHPVQVESVPWISPCTTVPCGFLLLVSLHAYLGYRDGSCPRRSYVAPLVAFAMALLLESAALVQPAAPLLLDLAHPGACGPGAAWRARSRSRRWRPPGPGWRS